jgi:Cft2 family RNA processing exonuclease
LKLKEKGCFTRATSTPLTRGFLKGAKMDYGDLDAVIIESTYADEDHTERLSWKNALWMKSQML